MLGLALTTPSASTTDVESDHASNLELPENNFPVPVLLNDDSNSPPILPVGVVFKDIKIGRGEYFYDAMINTNARHTDIMSLVKACKPYRNLKNVRKGDLFHYALDQNKVLHQFKFDLDDQESYLIFKREENGSYTPFELSYPVQHNTVAVSGIVDVSVFESLKKLNAPSVLATKMNDILGWEIDFRLDVRKGDAFKIIYEEIRRDGEFVRTGPILAVEYRNKGKLYSGFRYNTSKGRPAYFDIKGNSLEKQLLRAPLEYSRISSSFSYKRFHPVHKKYMPHLGIDYAAPVGTIVRAAGNGTIYAASYNRNNGRYIKIRHSNSSYETFYLHLSRLEPGIKKGRKVKQGQVIGYVGATGVATGPHLDYRVKKDGKFVNPRTIELPAAEPIAENEKKKFNSEIALLSYCLSNLSKESTPHQVATDIPLQYKSKMISTLTKVQSVP